MNHDRLMDIWWQIKAAFGVEYSRWVSFVDAGRILNFLECERVDPLQFSTALYAYDLLDQSLHYNSLPEIPNLDPRREGADGDFLGVTGILSTAWTRVCPAVLPTMLLYPDALLRKAIDDYMIPNQDKEIKTWLAYRQAFDDRVREVDFEITCLLGEYYKDLRNRISINAVREMYQLEHRVLDARIRYGIRGRRRC